MELFDKRFVHAMWDASLEGKECIVSDNIDVMVEAINNGTYHTAVINRSKGGGYSLHSNETGADYNVAYYDSNYECKRAYAEGKRIQFKSKSSDVWLESDFDPTWSDDLDYRIKPEESKSRRMTYRMLAEWAIKQNGEIKSPADPGYVFCDFSYREDLENKDISEGYKIRRWNSDEWIEPTVDVYEADCKKE